ncbi:MAG: MBL fold metallo-hydrolase [Oscillospiraceae bacterium]|nr:MBL fold metallo-hydrolase [Oscillospiraceae bacterium]
MFNKITNRIYYRPAEPYTDRPNVGLVTGEKYSLLFEAGNSAENVKKLKAELSEQGLPYPDFVAVSHWHWDHSFGLHAWDSVKIAGRKTNEKLLEVSRWKWDDASMAKRIENKDDIVFCSEMIKREYPDRNKICIVGADIVFDGILSIDLGGTVCELIHSKGPHSEDSVICYVPSEKVLFLGDSNCKDLYGKPWDFDIEHEEEFLDNIAAIPYDKELVEEYLAILDTLDFDYCISGHAGVLSRKELYDSFGE